MTKRIVRKNERQEAQGLVETLKDRVLDQLKKHGPQPWHRLIVELDPTQTGHIHVALQELQQLKTIKLKKRMVMLNEDVPQRRN